LKKEEEEENFARVKKRRGWVRVRGRRV